MNSVYLDEARKVFMADIYLYGAPYNNYAWSVYLEQFEIAWNWFLSAHHKQ